MEGDPVNAIDFTQFDEMYANIIPISVGMHHHPTTENPFDMLMESLQNVVGRGADSFTARCPGHDDQQNSLQVKRMPSGKISVQCFAGCEIDTILAPIGMHSRDLYPPKPVEEPRKPKQIECTYDYHDAAGRIVMQVIRYKPKSFQQRRPDPSKPGGWNYSLQGVERPLYRLPEVLKAKAEGRTIYLCEGEKDADNLRELFHVCATTNPGGINVWAKHYSDILAGANVVILPDNDEPGRKGAARRAEAIPGSVIVELPGLHQKGDVSDWLAAGGTLDELEELAQAQPGDKPAHYLIPFTDMTDAWDLAATELPVLFDGAMPMAELSVIASEPGLGKSYFALTLGLSIAFNRPLLNQFQPRPVNGRVCFLFGEDGPHPVAQRIRAICEAHGITREEFESAVSTGLLSFVCGDSAQLLSVEFGVLNKTPAYRELASNCERERYDLLVVDSFIQWAGVPNENDNAQMQVAAMALVELSRVTGGVVLALHHVSKQSAATGAATLHSMRGGGALAGKFRWGAVLRALSDQDAKEYGITQEERASYLLFDVVKSQYAPKFARTITLQRGPGGVLRETELVAKVKADLVSAIVAEMQENPVNLTARECMRLDGELAAGFVDAVFLRAGAKGDKKKLITEALKEAIDEGILIQVPNPSNPRRRELQVS